jgi:hypothetical protein
MIHKQDKRRALLANALFFLLCAQRQQQIGAFVQLPFHAFHSSEKHNIAQVFDKKEIDFVEKILFNERTNYIQLYLLPR